MLGAPGTRRLPPPPALARGLPRRAARSVRTCYRLPPALPAECTSRGPVVFVLGFFFCFFFFFAEGMGEASIRFRLLVRGRLSMLRDPWGKLEGRAGFFSQEPVSCFPIAPYPLPPLPSLTGIHPAPSPPNHLQGSPTPSERAPRLQCPTFPAPQPASPSPAQAMLRDPDTAAIRGVRLGGDSCCEHPSSPARSSEVRGWRMVVGERRESPIQVLSNGLNGEGGRKNVKAPNPQSRLLKNYN
jgi:hypothetical protein